MNASGKMLCNAFGNPFPAIVIIFSYLLLPISLMLLLEASFFLSALAFLLAVYILFSRYGVEFNAVDKTYRNYVALFGYKRGEQLSYAAYPDVAILRKRMKTEAISRGNVVSTIKNQASFYLYLLDQQHHRRILVAHFLNEEEAKEKALKWAEMLGVNYVNYNPVVSAQTRKNRRR